MGGWVCVCLCGKGVVKGNRNRKGTRVGDVQRPPCMYSTPRVDHHIRSTSGTTRDNPRPTPCILRPPASNDYLCWVFRTTTDTGLVPESPPPNNSVFSPLRLRCLDPLVKVILSCGSQHLSRTLSFLSSLKTISNCVCLLRITTYPSLGKLSLARLHAKASIASRSIERPHTE